MLGLIFWVFVFVLGLSYFGISIETVINSPAGQANFAYLLQTLSELWSWITAQLPPSA